MHTTLHWIDWLIVAITLAVAMGMAIFTKRYTRSVADFLAANRCAGRYLLCVAGGMASLGAISFIAMFEMYYTAGLTANWWTLISTPTMLLISISGWIIYRYRETRSLTIAQFFETRYSRRFRVFAGILAWVSGVINFGIFPAVGTRFFIYFCGLPETIPGTGIPTFVVVMLLLLCTALFFVFLGGQIAIMVTDFLQGMFTNITLLAIIAFFLFKFDWSVLIETLQQHSPEGISMIDPMRASKVKGFTPFYFIIMAFTQFYGYLAWQGNQGYNASAKSAHEAKMASILGSWRTVVLMLLMLVLPLCVFMVMHNPAFATRAIAIKEVLDQIGDETIRTQMTVPVGLAHILPVGLVGMFCATMLAAFISTHDTYLHSWGSIFVQDVILPLRKKPMSPQGHIRALRGSILLVAVIIFFFSLLFRQNEFILMFFSVTGAIYIGGAGSAIIGGLYWKRGSTAGAWVALCIGAVCALSGLVGRQLWTPVIYPWLESDAPGLLAATTWLLEGVANRVPGINWAVGPDEFPINSQWVFFFSILLSITGYVACSLFAWLVSGRPAHNMDKLLHRNEYAVKGDHAKDVVKPVTGIRALLPSREFTRGDRIIYFLNLGWSLGWFAVFLFGCAWAATRGISEAAWIKFWGWRIGIILVVAVGTTLWFLAGGIRDMVDLFRRLSSIKRNEHDDGTVE